MTQNVRPYLAGLLRVRSTRGVTLIEILVALLILLMGLAGVFGLLYGSIDQGREASDRNAAAILLPEALRQIELEHLINTNIGGTPAQVGMYVETLDYGPESDTGYFASAMVSTSGDPPKGATVALAETGNLNHWPHIADNPRSLGGAPYRVRYRLEKHPEWWPHDDSSSTYSTENVGSSYRGMWVLTAVVFRDDDKLMTNPTQVSDPVVLYLNDKKVR